LTSDWQHKPLKPFCLKIGSGATPRGGSKVYLEAGEISLIRSQNVYNDGFHKDGLVYIDKLSAEKLNNVNVSKDDVLLNITGDSVARACMTPDEVLPARVNQHVAIIRPNPDEFNPFFLWYWLVAQRTQEWLLVLASSGATRNALTKGMIEDLQVPKPHIDTQNYVAETLNYLTDQIHLNQQINQTLESIAQTIFKSWFVDFDPVKAKMVGREPEGMDAETAALFPDNLVESEIGMIPEGWEVKPLSGIATFLNGLALQKYPASEGDPYFPVLKIAELRGGFGSRTNKANTDVPNNYIVQDGDIIFSWSGSLLAKQWSLGEAALNQHLFKVTSDSYPKWFYYQWILHHLPEFRSIAAGKATTMGHIQRKHLNEAKVLVPPQVLMKSADSILRPILDMQLENDLNSRTLGELRDTLLPKLISGEIQIPME